MTAPLHICIHKRTYCHHNVNKQYMVLLDHILSMWSYSVQVMLHTDMPLAVIIVVRVATLGTVAHDHSDTQALLISPIFTVGFKQIQRCPSVPFSYKYRHSMHKNLWQPLKHSPPRPLQLLP